MKIEETVGYNEGDFASNQWYSMDNGVIVNENPSNMFKFLEHQ